MVFKAVIPEKRHHVIGIRSDDGHAFNRIIKGQDTVVGQKNNGLFSDNPCKMTFFRSVQINGTGVYIRIFKQTQPEFHLQNP